MAGNSNSGPRPKPTALKILEGNRGRRPLPDREPKPAIVLPKPPDDLDMVARKEWARVASELYAIGILSTLDVGVLAEMCAAHSICVRARREMRRQGEIIKGKGKGRDYVNPWWRVFEQSRNAKIKCMIELGMTPSARSRVRVDEIPKFDSETDAQNRDEFLDGE